MNNLCPIWYLYIAVIDKLGDHGHAGAEDCAPALEDDGSAQWAPAVHRLVYKHSSLTLPMNVNFFIGSVTFLLATMSVGRSVGWLDGGRFVCPS